MTSPSPELLLGLARRYQIQHLAASRRVTTAVLALWTRSSPVDDVSLAAWIAAVTPVVATAQHASAGLGVSFVRAYTDLIGGPAPVRDVNVESSRGVTTESVYARPVITVRAALARGESLERALQVGRDRLERTVMLDQHLAARAGWDASMRVDQRIVGYRRVTDGNACRLCMLASTQRYRVGDLLPIHARCGCTVAPIVGQSDPGHVIDRELFAAMNSDQAARSASDLDEIRSRYESEVAVREHGELGPTLTRAGDHFTTEDELAA